MQPSSLSLIDTLGIPSTGVESYVKERGPRAPPSRADNSPRDPIPRGWLVSRGAHPRDTASLPLTMRAGNICSHQA